MSNFHITTIAISKVSIWGIRIFKFNKKHLIIFFLSISLLLESCATVVVLHQSKETTDSLSESDFKGKSVTIRFVKFVAIKKENNTSILYIKENTHLKSTLESSFIKSNIFSTINFSTIESNEIQIENLDFNHIDDYYPHNYKVETNYVLDIYTVDTALYNHPWLMLPLATWTTMSVLTFGLLPAWLPHEVKFTAVLKNQYGKKLNQINILRTANQWVWSPLIFYTSAKRTDDKELLNDFTDSSVIFLMKEISIKNNIL